MKHKNPLKTVKMVQESVIVFNSDSITECMEPMTGQLYCLQPSAVRVSKELYYWTWGAVIYSHLSAECCHPCSTRHSAVIWGTLKCQSVSNLSHASDMRNVSLPCKASEGHSRKKPGWLFMCYTVRKRLVRKYAVIVYIQKLLLSNAAKGSYCKELPILAESKHSAQWGCDECLHKYWRNYPLPYSPSL